MFLLIAKNRAGSALALAGVLGLVTALCAVAQQTTAQPQSAPSQNSQPDSANTPATQPTPDSSQTQTQAPAQPTPDSSQTQAPDSPHTAPETTTTQTPDQTAGQAQPAPQPAPQQSADDQQRQDKSEPSGSEQTGGVTEDELKRTLLGKPLFLRGGYLSDNLTYNEHGALIGHAPLASYTLCGIQVDRVRLTRHKIELEGARYGLHFLGALAYEDPTKAVDRVKITPKKKIVKITIDRELVVRPKKPKGEKKNKSSAGAKDKTDTSEAEKITDQTNPGEMSEEDQKKAEIAAAPEAERPADPNSVTTTTSPAHAAKVLKEAIDNVFAQGIDDRMIAAMPDFWKLYYQAAAAKTDYRPTDQAVMRQSAVDKKATLLSTFEPPSNQFAQDNGVAGMSLYHVVIDAQGKPAEIAVARPIGFGLDENAVEAIGNAKFDPAIKDGKPVPVLLDLVVQFRIYSKRTAASGTPSGTDQASDPVLPGPYSAAHPQDTKPAQ